MSSTPTKWQVPFNFVTRVDVMSWRHNRVLPLSATPAILVKHNQGLEAWLHFIRFALESGYDRLPLVLPLLNDTYFEVMLQVWSMTTYCRCSGSTSSGSQWRLGMIAYWSCSEGISTTCCATSTSSTIISPPYFRACALRPSGVVPLKTEV